MPPTTITYPRGLQAWDPAPTPRDSVHSPTGMSLNDAATALRFGAVARPYNAR